MRFSQIRTIALLAATATGLSACTIYDGYGTGAYGDRYANKAYPDECYDKEGYLYEGCEDAGYIARNGYGYGSIFYHNNYGPYGWYDGFYYPGYSSYIYDRRGRRHSWGNRHRRHWEGQRHARRGQDGRRGGRRSRNADNRDQRSPDGRRGNRRGNRNPTAGTGTVGTLLGVAPNNRRRNADGGRRNRAPATQRTAPPAQAREARDAPVRARNRRANNRTRQTRRMRDAPRDTNPE